jgi:hypothetical protein
MDENQLDFGAAPLQTDGSADKAQKKREPTARAKDNPSQDSTTDDSKQIAQRLGDMVKDPTTGGALVGAAVVGSAFLIGVPETAVGAIAGYVAYQILRKMKH